MKKQNFLSRAIAAVAIMLIWAGGASVDAQQLNPAIYGPQVNTIPKDATEYVPNEVIVKFKDASGVEVKCTSKRKIKTTSVQSLDDKLASLGISEAEQLMPLTGAKKLRQNKAPLKSLSGREVVEPDLSRLYLMKVDSTRNISMYEVIEQLESLDEVEYAEPNYRVYAMTTGESDTYKAEPLYSQQWGLEAINMPALWDVPKVNDKRPVIAIIDTGVDTEHPDLKDNLWINEAELNGEDYIDDDNNGFVDDVYGWDFIKNRPAESDPNGHGTHCAGIAAAVGNNGIGITGTNPDALIMSIRVLDKDGTGNTAEIVKGIDYATANGADVISMSFGGGPSPSSSEYDACRKAFQTAILVAAAGNNKKYIDFLGTKPGRMFPAAFDVVIGVQASDGDGERPEFSNYDHDGEYYTNHDVHGENFYNYEVYAPGVGIMSTYPGGQYKELHGTSMATPFVAGVVSRLLQTKERERYNGTLVGDIVHARNEQTSMKVLDAYKAHLFNESNRQTEFVIQNVEISDAEAGDNDGQPESGEIIDLYPTVRCIWGNASDIRLSVEADDEYEHGSAFESIYNDVDLGYTLNSQGSAKSQNPIRIKLNENFVNNHNLRLIVKVKIGDYEQKKQIEFIVKRSDALPLVISEDLTLTPDKEYIVDRLAVINGAVITVLPGTKLRFYNTKINIQDGKLLCKGTPENPIYFTSFTEGRLNSVIFTGASSEKDTLSYVIFDKEYAQGGFTFKGFVENCIIKEDVLLSSDGTSKCNYLMNNQRPPCENSYYNNLVTNKTATLPADYLGEHNIIGDYNIFYQDLTDPSTYTPINPPYFGTASEDVLRKRITDFYTGNGWGIYDLSTMRKVPVAEAHGIVWKVVVNGYDAQDEYELLPPFGVGKHKFEVYFNRPMNKTVTPTVAMGAADPYNQIPINEDGSWNEEGTIYTVYLTIDGKMGADGINRIYVAGAQDEEYVEIPVESMRFNVFIQASGSLSTGMMARAGIGKVTLSWETDEEDFEDLLGYNILRYTEHTDSIYETDFDKYGDWEQHLVIKGDTTIINETLIDSRDQSFTDYNVVPGTTYYYQIKQMTTSLTSHDLSNVVSATPLTASKGDANGSMNVDVADVVTEVAYMTYQDPQPFIFEAADVITDSVINVLDVVGTVNIIKTPAGAMAMSVDNSAIYTIEDGIMYVESYIPLGGVQFRFNVGEYDEIIPLEALDGFETVSDNQGDNGYLFFAFSMSGKVLPTGKHALLQIGNAEITEVVLSDATGKNVVAIDGKATGLGTIEAMQMTLPYPNPFDEVLTIPYKIGKEGRHDVKIVVSTIAGSTVAEHCVSAEYGEYSWNWYAGESVQAGVYFVSLYVDDKLMQTAKVVKK